MNRPDAGPSDQLILGGEHRVLTQRSGLDRWGPVVIVAGIALAVTIRDPHASGSWAVCPTFGLFGIACPGCGSLRAMHDLVAGRVIESIGHNALLLPGMLFLLAAAIRPPGRWWSMIWLVVLTGFTLVRNIPGSPLAP